MRTFVSSFAFALLFTGAACGPSDDDGGGGGGSGADGGLGACTEGQSMCDGNSFLTCQDGSFQVSEQCPILCDGTLGCIECQPDRDYCVGDEVHACDASGNQAGLVETCSGGLHCSTGDCVDLCAQAEDSRSYLGCEYWAVDLDNAIEVLGPPSFLGCLQGVERSDLFVCEKAEPGLFESPFAGLCDVPGNTCPDGSTCKNVPACVLDAKGSPFAIVVSNPQGFAVQVALETEGGAGQPLSL